jgi:hypothetical protein
MLRGRAGDERRQLEEKQSDNPTFTVSALLSTLPSPLLPLAHQARRLTAMAPDIHAETLPFPDRHPLILASRS